MDAPRQGGHLQGRELLPAKPGARGAARRHGCQRGRASDPADEDRQERQACRPCATLRGRASRSILARSGRLQPAAADVGVTQPPILRPGPPGLLRRRRTELLGRRHVSAERCRLLSPLRQVLRARPAALHEHRPPGTAHPGRGPEPDPSRPRLRAVPGAPIVHDPRRRSVVGRRHSAHAQVPQPATDDLGVVAEAPPTRAPALPPDARHGSHPLRLGLPRAVDAALSRRGQGARPHSRGPRRLALRQCRDLLLRRLERPDHPLPDTEEQR